MLLLLVVVPFTVHGQEAGPPPLTRRQVEQDLRLELELLSPDILEAGGTPLTTVTAGGIFGEMSLIDRSPRSATATADGGCEVAPINEKAFLYLVHETPYFSLDVMRVLAVRVRLMNALI